MRPSWYRWIETAATVKIGRDRLRGVDRASSPVPLRSSSGARTMSGSSKKYAVTIPSRAKLRIEERELEAGGLN